MLQFTAFANTNTRETTNGITFAESGPGVFIDEATSLVLPRRLMISSKVSGTGQDSFSLKLIESIDHDADVSTPAQTVEAWLGVRGDFRTYNYAALQGLTNRLYGAMYANVAGKLLANRLHGGQKF